MSIKESIASMRQPTDAAVDDELRESLRTHGWVAEFPAIDDEHGVRLIGNRRTRLAAELGIAPVVKVLTLGEGEAADAERLKLAFVSNIGGRPLSAEDKKRLAIHLYKQGWTQQRIGDALGVGQPMVVKYLAGVDLSPGNKSKPQPKTASNPRGSGRRKGPPKPKRPPILAPEQEVQLAQAVLDEGKTHKEAEERFGVSDIVVRRVVNTEKGRREAHADPQIDPATLSMTAQEKLASAVRQHKKRLDAEYDRRRSAEIDQHIKDVVRPLMQKRLDDAERVIRARNGVMTRPVYKKIWSCLHPDRLAALRAGDEKLERRFAEAFSLFSDLEVVLCDEKEMPTPRLVLTPEMMAARKAEVQAQRRAQRAAKSKGNGSTAMQP